MLLKDKIAIITGGSRGIGKAIALEMAREGAKIVVNYASDSSKGLADEVVEEARKLGTDGLAVKCDISNFESSKEMVDQAMEKFGRIDILVNNAGITKDALNMRMTEDDFDRVIEVNLKGTWNMIKHVTNPMMKQRYGRIVNMSSVIGIIGNAGQVNYAASKAGVIGITKSIAKEYGSRGITCNAIAPGYIMTDMTSVLSEDVTNAIKDKVPSKQLGEAQDIANATVFLASDKAKYITGQVLNVCGGMVM